MIKIQFIIILSKKTQFYRNTSIFVEESLEFKITDFSNNSKFCRVILENFIVKFNLKEKV